MNIRYEITIGEAGPGTVAVLASKYFDGATVSGANIGIWKGEAEPSVTVTVIGSPALYAQVARFAQTAAHQFNQDRVLVTSIPLSVAVLIGSAGEVDDIGGVTVSEQTEQERKAAYVAIRRAAGAGAFVNVPEKSVGQGPAITIQTED